MNFFLEAFRSCAAPVLLPKAYERSSPRASSAGVVTSGALLNGRSQLRGPSETSFFPDVEMLRVKLSSCVGERAYGKRG